MVVGGRRVFLGSGQICGRLVDDRRVFLDGPSRGRSCYPASVEKMRVICFKLCFEHSLFSIALLLFRAVLPDGSSAFWFLQGGPS